MTPETPATEALHTHPLHTHPANAPQETPDPFAPGSETTQSEPKKGYELPDALHVYMEDQAAPTRIQVTLPSDKMKLEMDAKFVQFEQNLTDAQRKHLTKGGYRKITRERVFKKFGGMEGFYGEMLHDAVRRESLKKGRDILTTVSLNVQEMEHGLVIQSIVFLEPTVEFKYDLPAVFKYHMSGLTDEMVEARVQQRIKQLQEEYAVWVPVARPDHDLKPGDFVTMSLDTYLDGERIAPFSWKEQRVQFRGNEGQPKPFFLDAQLATTAAIVGASSGFHFIQHETDGVDGDGQPLSAPFAGQTFTGTITIHRIEMKELPAAGEDLAITANWDNYTKMHTQFTKDAEEAITREREDTITSSVINSLAERADVSPIPEMWARRRSEELMRSQLKQFSGSEKRLCQIFGVQSIEHLVAIHYGQMRKSLRLQLVIRAWGIQMGVPGDTSLGATPQYAETVQRHILNTIQLEDAQPEGLVAWWPDQTTPVIESRNDGSGVDPEE